MRNCRQCGVELQLGVNYRRSLEKAKHYRCKPCITKDRRDYYHKNKEHIIALRKEYRKNNPEYLMYARAKNRAKELGLEFNIEISDIIIPDVCPVFKQPFTFNVKQNKFSPSLDRVDSSKGYIKGNVQVISHLANTMKSNASKDELIMFAKWITQTPEIDTLLISRYD